MKRLYSKRAGRRTRARRGEDGIFLLIVAGIFFGLLAVLGFAIDSGNLYRAQMRMQRAVDAGVVSGIYLLTTPGPVPAERTARSITELNLNRTGLKNVSVSVTRPRAGELRVAAEADVGLLLLGSIPGFGNRSRVSASALGESSSTQQKVAIELVLDITGSMNCPARGFCSLGCTQTDTCPRPTRLDALKQAAVTFVNQFDEETTKFGLVTFSASAQVRWPINSAFSKGELATIINGLHAIGGTNITDGVSLGKNQLHHAQIDQDYKKIFVLVTDGAPSVESETERCDEPGVPVCGIRDARRCYIKALQAADQLRADTGAPFYAIGLGDSAPASNDPYQNATDQLMLKSTFMKRLANASGNDTDPAFNCVPDYVSYNRGAPPPTRGTYLETPDATQLGSLFGTIARSIAARLTS